MIDMVKFAGQVCGIPEKHECNKDSCFFCAATEINASHKEISSLRAFLSEAEKEFGKQLHFLKVLRADGRLPEKVFDTAIQAGNTFLLKLRSGKI